MLLLMHIAVIMDMSDNRLQMLPAAVAIAVVAVAVFLGQIFVARSPS